MASSNEIEIYLKSAKDLKNVNWRHGFNKPYAVIWVDPSRQVSSWVAKQDICAEWNQTLVIPLDGPIEEATLRIDIKHAGEIYKPLIGSVEIPLREVVDVGIGSRASRELKLKRPSGRLQGKLEIDVAVRQPRLHATEPNKALYELLGNALPLQVDWLNLF